MCFMWWHVVNPLDWTKPRKLEVTQRVTLQSPLDPLFSKDTCTVSNLTSSTVSRLTSSKGDPNVNCLKHRGPEVTEPLYPFQKILTSYHSTLTTNFNPGTAPATSKDRLDNFALEAFMLFAAKAMQKDNGQSTDLRPSQQLRTSKWKSSIKNTRSRSNKSHSNQTTILKLPVGANENGKLPLWIAVMPVIKAVEGGLLVPEVPHKAAAEVSTIGNL